MQRIGVGMNTRLLLLVFLLATLCQCSKKEKNVANQDAVKVEEVKIDAVDRTVEKEEAALDAGVPKVPDIPTIGKSAIVEIICPEKQKETLSAVDGVDAFINLVIKNSRKLSEPPAAETMCKIVVRSDGQHEYAYDFVPYHGSYPVVLFFYSDNAYAVDINALKKWCLIAGLDFEKYFSLAR